jgi:hypothetical protein
MRINANSPIEHITIRVPSCIDIKRVPPQASNASCYVPTNRPTDSIIVVQHGSPTRATEISFVRRYVLESRSKINNLLNNNRNNNSVSKWMELLGSMDNSTHSIGSLSLAQFVLPGSHDSGTFNLTLEAALPPDAFIGVAVDICHLLRIFGVKLNCSNIEEVSDVISYPWAVTETMDWWEQLTIGGARSFDYRGYYDKSIKTWVAQHSLAGGLSSSVANLTQSVASFLQQNRGELVLIEYTVYQGGNESDLVQQLVDGVAPFGYLWQSGVTIPGNPSISDMIAANQRAIIVRANGNQQGNVSQGISNDWPNSCNNSFIHQYDQKAIANFASMQPDAMRKFAWQATADVECIVFGMLGVIENNNDKCQKLFGFNCTATLMGIINQLNSEFSLQLVLDAYTSVTPLSKALYFGNVWNFDHPNPRLTVDDTQVLNAIVLANRARTISTNKHIDQHANANHQ